MHYFYNQGGKAYLKEERRLHRYGEPLAMPAEKRRTDASPGAGRRGPQRSRGLAFAYSELH